MRQNYQEMENFKQMVKEDTLPHPFLDQHFCMTAVPEDESSAVTLEPFNEKDNSAVDDDGEAGTRYVQY